MSDRAHGTFDVTITPQPTDDSGIGRLDLAKRWHGDLLATGTGLMLSAGDPTLGRAGYVALETVTGTLHGREGGFAFQQYGVMRGDQRALPCSTPSCLAPARARWPGSRAPSRSPSTTTAPTPTTWTTPCRRTGSQSASRASSSSTY